MALATAYRTGPAIIKRVLVAHGVPIARAGSGRCTSPDRAAEILKLWDDGWSAWHISQHLNAGMDTVRRVVSDAGRDGTENRLRVGAESHAWRGGRVVTPNGYVRVYVEPDDPLALMRDRYGYVLEHRLVMARSLGRPLGRYETVHHRDGDRSHNALTNLQLRQGNHGKGAVMRCAECGSINLIAADI